MLGPLQIGIPGMLRTGGKRYPVSVVGIHERAVHVSFPGETIPGNASVALLDFEDMLGVASYYVQVISPPGQHVEGAILWRVASLDRGQRRAYLRVPAELDIRARHAAREEWQSAFLEDVSQGGASFLCPAKFERGGDAVLDVTFPEAPTVNVSGKIVYASEAKQGDRYRYGIKFMDMRPNSVNTILAFIREHLRKVLPGQVTPKKNA